MVIDAKSGKPAPELTQCCHVCEDKLENRNPSLSTRSVDILERIFVSSFYVYLMCMSIMPVYM